MSQATPMIAALSGQPAADLRRQALLALLTQRRSGNPDRTDVLAALQAAQAAPTPAPVVSPTPLAAPAATATSSPASATVPQGTGDWTQYVGQPERRSGPSKPHQSGILSFVGQVGKVAGTKLTPWGNESHSLTTVNGNRSAHADGNAADIPASGAELVRLGQAALIAAGMSPAEARKQKGGLFNIGGKQVIFATNQGGNHFDHVHVGLRG